MLFQKTVLASSIALVLLSPIQLNAAGSCGGYDFNSYSSSIDWGGVSLNKTAKLLLQLEDVDGAIFDEGTGQVVFYGKERLELPKMNLDDLTVAVRSVFGYGGEDPQDPGVSIGTEASDVPGMMKVRYDGQTRNTNFGKIMFDADRLLKVLSNGQDNITGQTVFSRVPGYKSLLDRYLEQGRSANNKKGQWSSRMWFVPSEVTLKKSADGNAMEFEKVAMKLLNESKFLESTGNVPEGGILESIAPKIKEDGTVFSDPASEGFAKHFTENYDKFADEFPILQELKRLGKITAVIKWIKNNDIPFDLSFVKSYEPKFVKTEDYTPSTKVTRSRGNYSLTTIGGVDFRLTSDNFTEKNDAQAGIIRNEILNARPKETNFSWEFNKNGEKYKAVAQSFARTRKDGNVHWSTTDMSFPVAGNLGLSLTRYYNSFNEQSGAMGRGWRLTPYKLRFADGIRYYIVTLPNGTEKTIPSYYRVFVSKGGSEQPYKLYTLDKDYNPVLVSETSQDQLVYKPETKTFELVNPDKTHADFDRSGRLTKITDNNGQSLSYRYSSNKEDAVLTQIAHGSGSAITLTHNNGRLVSSSGPGNTSVQYQYGSQKELVSVTKAGKTNQYQYDDELRLTAITDARNETIFSASYDDYNRAGEQQYAANASSTSEFDLSARKSTTTNAKGLSSTKYYDKDFRLLTAKDSAGRQVDYTWKTPFGPSTITDPRGATSKVSYDRIGNVTQTTDANGASRQFYRNANGKLIYSQNSQNRGVYNVYDDKNRLVKSFKNANLLSGGRISYDSRYTTEYKYDNVGNVTSVKSGSGRDTQQANIKYNKNGLPIEITAPDGRKTYREYDSRSRLSRVRDKVGELARYSYNDANQLLSTTTPSGTIKNDYDDNGNLTSKTDARGNSTYYNYNADNKLSQVIDPEGGVTAYRYDIHGKLTQVTLPNGVQRTINYDQLDRPKDESVVIAAKPKDQRNKLAKAEVK